MATGYYQTAVDEQGRRIYSDSGEYIPLWKRDGKKWPAESKSSSGGAGAGIAGLAASVGGKYLATKIPGWISGASAAATPAAEVGATGAGSFFGSGGATAGQQALANSLGSEIGITGGGGIGGAGGGGGSLAAGSSFMANTLPAIGAYAVPLLAAAGLAYGINKGYGSPKSHREPSEWAKTLASGYKYMPEGANVWNGANTNPNPTADDLIKSSVPAKYIGNAWMERFTPEDRTSIMQALLDQGGVNERLGGYDVNKNLLTSLADTALTNRGEQAFVADRMDEYDTRKDLLRRQMYDRESMTQDEKARILLNATGVIKDDPSMLGADWLPTAVRNLRNQD